MKKILNLMSKDSVVLFLLLLCGGILSCGLKYDLFWDFVNYHYFNPWAFLNGRINYDVGAAGMNAFFNPLPDIPLYLLIKYFNDYPNFICFMQGLWFGVLLFLFFKVVCLVVDTSTRVGKLQVFVILLVGATGWSTFMQIGTSTNEIQISVFIMAGLYVLLKEMYAPKQNKWLFLLSGLLLGVAMGLKLTAVTYCVSSALAIFLYYRKLERPLEKIFFFAAGGISGFLIFNGFWMYILWEHFQNPFFPFANEIFKSEYASIQNIRDTRFIPHTLGQFIMQPFLLFARGFEIASDGDGYVSESRGFIIDYRLILAYVFFLLFILYEAGNRLFRKRFAFDWNTPSGFLLLFTLLSYLIWALLFSLFRYMVPIELLLALFVVKIIFLFIPRSDWAKILYISLVNLILFLLISVPFFSESWGSRKMDNVSYKEGEKISDYNGEKFIFIEEVDIPDDALVLFYEYPVSAVLPYWFDFLEKKNIRGLSVWQSMYITTDKGRIVDYYDYNPKWRAMRREIMDKHQGPVIAVSGGNTQDPLGILEKMSCRGIPNNMLPLILCVPPELEHKVWKNFEQNSKTFQKNMEEK